MPAPRPPIRRLTPTLGRLVALGMVVGDLTLMERAGAHAGERAESRAQLLVAQDLLREALRVDLMAYRSAGPNPCLEDVEDVHLGAAWQEVWTRLGQLRAMGEQR